MNQQQISMQDVHYTYPDQTPALQRISLSIEQGEAIALIGGNGAGKSTLLSLLVGIFFPTVGKISIGGLELTPKNATLVRRKVGMVFQNPDDQLFIYRICRCRIRTVEYGSSTRTGNPVGRIGVSDCWRQSSDEPIVASALAGRKASSCNCGCFIDDSRSATDGRADIGP